MKEVVIIANDVVPGMAGPVAAPGLRAWGLAQGLRSHGYKPLIAVDARVVKTAWPGRVPSPTPHGTLPIAPTQFGELIRSRRPAAVIMTNSNHIDSLSDLAGVPLVYDFFAPKALELAEQADPSTRSGELARLEARKLRGLRASRAVIINGTKKVGYVERWLDRAKNPDVPKAVVNMPLEPTRPMAPDVGPVRIVVSGYLQPWSSPGPWAEAIRPFLATRQAVLHLLIAKHWGGHAARAVLPKMFRDLGSLANVRIHGWMDFLDFRRFLAACHVSLDLFARNPERELAFVTRSAVAISCGLAAVHVPFTEVSELIKRDDAGWLVDGEDVDAIYRVFQEAIGQPELLAQKRAGARIMSSRLEPHEAVAPLVDLLAEL
jgi:glycosyltransferase involved in cell wall biosynthesis